MEPQVLMPLAMQQEAEAAVAGLIIIAVAVVVAQVVLVHQAT
jgi:hypothetical protein